MGEQRRLSVCGLLAESEKTISEVSTVAISGTDVGELIIYDTVSSRIGNSTIKHRWQTESALPLIHFLSFPFNYLFVVK